MKPWISVTGTLCVGLLFAAGCAQYSEEKAFKEELPQSVEVINAVVTRVGTEVRFDDNGGSYHQEFILSGATVNGQPVTVLSTGVREFRTKSPAFVPLEQIPPLKVSEVLTTTGGLVEFASPGGTIQKERVIGVDKKKILLEVPRKLVAGGRLASPPAVELSQDVPVVPITEVVLRDSNTLVRFDSAGARTTFLRDVVMGMTPASTFAVVPLDSILYLKVKRYDAFKSLAVSIGAVAGIALVVGAIIAATKQSCPFLYSYDGHSYVFDAEPLGGATTAGLARTDFSRMEHLQPVNGAYRVLLRNEVEETQYVDRLQLMYCDHDASLTPIASGGDAVVLVRSSIPPSSAYDEQGADLLPFFRSQDGISWETHMLSYAGNPEEPTHHTLRFVFPKPAGATRATVIVHGGTTLWGSTMIRVLYQLRGRDVDSWYRDADQHGPRFSETMMWLDREDLFTMPLFALREGKWIERGILDGGGPLVHETQTRTFPLSRFAGDSLELCVRPPKGFWSFDEISVTYDSVARTQLLPLEMMRAVDQRERDITSLLAMEDRQYYEMPTQLDEATITWSAPPVPSGKQRTLFARTSGYYLLHLSKEGPGELETLHRFLTTQGEVVRYAAHQYRAWKAALRAQAQRGLR